MKTLQKHMYQQIILMVSLIGIWGPEMTSLAQSTASANDPNQLLNPPVIKRYHVNYECLSLDPNRPMKSYKRHGSGEGSPGSTLGPIIKDDTRSIEIRIHCQLNDNRFLVQVRTTPYGNDTVTQARTIDLDLTDLQARAIEVARNADGRIYWINMTPSIKIINHRAKRLKESALKLTQWDLIGCPVVINDNTFAGNMGVSGGPVAYVEYPTIGRIEFSLVPYKGAEPAGILFNGHLTLHYQEQTVDIYGVQNGEPAMRLPGGPYKVWAKWSPLEESELLTEIPSTVEEFMQLVKADFAERGQTPPGDDELRAAYEKLKEMKRLPLSYGSRGISKSERIE